MRYLAGMFAVAIAAPLSGGQAVAQAEGNAPASIVTMPSGHVAELLDHIWDEDQSVIRPRYVVEELSYPGSAYANNVFEVFDDMQWLCNTQIRNLFAPDEVPQSQGWDGAIIAMMSAPLDFGTRDPDVIQFFESFLFTDDGCTLDDDEYHD